MRGLTRNQLLLTLAAVVLLAVGIVFVVLYSQAVSHQAAVASDIETTETDIARMSSSDLRLTYDVVRLNTELTRLQSELAEADIPTEVDNVEVFDDIHLAAVSSKVSYDYEYSDKSTTIGGTRYTAMTFEIDTSGTLVRIIRFISLLEELDYDTLRITDIELDLGTDKTTWDVDFTIEIIVQGG